MTQKKKMTWAEWERAERTHMTLPNGDVIYEGDYGVTRDGRKVGPIAFDLTGNLAGWNDSVAIVHAKSGMCRSNGKVHNDDIIAKWVDPDTPKLWRDMTDAEKGALLLAHHEGKEIEVYDTDTGEWRVVRAEWIEYKAHRRKPEPKKPREWLISMDTMHVQSVPSGFKPDGTATSYIHVREVMGDDQ